MNENEDNMFFSVLFTYDYIPELTIFLSVQEPFPMGTNIRSRLGKPRSSGNEESHRQGIPSASTNGEESPNGSDSSGSLKDLD